MESKTHNISDEGGAPKRRIVKRIVRRVPSAAALARKAEESAAQVLRESEEEVQHTVESPQVIASLPPTETISSPEPSAFSPVSAVLKAESKPDASTDPKTMILEQLISRHTKEVQREPQREQAAPTIMKQKVSEIVETEEPVVISGIISGSAIAPQAPMSSTKVLVPSSIEKTPPESMVPGISREGRSSIQSVWPYLAAAKQGGEGEVHETSRADLEEGDNDGQKYFGWLPWFFGALIVIGGAFAAISYFSGADVVVVPKSESRAVDVEIATEKDSDPQKVMPLLVLDLTDTTESDIQASESQVSASVPAFGKITVFNSQASVQPLIKGTRFASVTGKIYKIKVSISVPAAKNGTPGKIDADVYAESPGPSYNINDKERFTLPGLKSSDKFTKVWATNAQPIMGGTDKLSKTLGKAAEDAAVGTAQMDLQKKLRDRIAHELLSSQVAYEPLYVFKYDDPITTNSEKPGMVHLTIKGHLITPLFDRIQLTQAIATSVLGASYKGESITMNGLERLNVVLADKDKDADLAKFKTAAFHVTGTVNFKWIVDVEKFRGLLINIEKDKFESTVHTVSSIKTAEATLRPFWKQYFPANTSQIMVKVQQ